MSRISLLIQQQQRKQQMTKQIQQMIVNNVEFTIVEKSATRQVYFNKELIALIVDCDNHFELHYIENRKNIGGDECASIEECFDTLIDYYGLTV